jgi:hypothetical protein
MGTHIHHLEIDPQKLPDPQPAPALLKIPHRKHVTLLILLTAPPLLLHEANLPILPITPIRILEIDELAGLEHVETL